MLNFKYFVIILIFYNVHKLQASENETGIIRKSCNEGLGQCVPISLCSEKTKFTDGSKFINTRFSLFDEDENDCHYLEKCCDPENIMTSTESQSFIVENINHETESACIQQCRAEDVRFQRQRLPPKIEILSQEADYQQCGYRNKFGVGLQLTNASDVAQFGEFPWMVALKEVINSESFYICGGSLIHPSVVLTGAHCVYKKESSTFIARVGEWDTQTLNEPFPHYDHKVQQMILHPEFVSKSLYNDIALLSLESPVKLTAHISTICLPPQNFKFTDKNCFASGWGAAKFEEVGVYRVNLKKIKLPIVQLKDCQDRLRSTQLGKLFKIHLNFLCAGGEREVDTCIGDGGSPLVCAVPDEVDYYYQAGIVSWGVGCGYEGIPGVYVNVAKFRNWIDEKMNELGLRTKSYTF